MWGVEGGAAAPLNDIQASFLVCRSASSFPMAVLARPLCRKPRLFHQTMWFASGCGLAQGA